MRWHFFSGAEALCAAVVAQFAETANASIAAHGSFQVALAGGRTPTGIYEKLRGIDTDWSRWFIYFGDERCLPRGDCGRNDTMARASWLDHVSIPSAQIHAIPAELGAEQGAAAYATALAALREFDLVLLGLGEDGHTASLFPGHALDAQAAAVAVHAAPKPPAERISLSAGRLSAARAVWFLVTGAEKREALRRWQRGEAIPAASIKPTAGVDIYTDLDLSGQR